MSNTDASHHYDELGSEPASPGLSTPGEEVDSSIFTKEGDLEAGTVQQEKATGQQSSGLSRALRSLRWKRATKDEDVSETPEPARKPPEYTDEARKLVRSFTRVNFESDTKDNRSGTDTPALDKHIHDLDYVPPPEQYKPSIFGALLSSKLNSLNDASQNRDYYSAAEPHHSRARSHDRLSSGTATPSRKIHWYDKPEGSSVTSLLAQSALSTTSTAVPATSRALPRSHTPRPKSWASIDPNDEVVAEVSDIIARRKYLTKLCAALMKNGAPTHRLEEYLAASARSLAIDADFLFIPGAMVCTFIDHSIYANNVEIVRRTAGLDFGRLKDVFDIYKCVIHKKLTAQEAILELDNIQNRPDRHTQYSRILMFALASCAVGPFSFNSRLIDMGPIFLMSCILGFLQIKIVPRSEQFSNVFEVFSCVLIAFASRALGSIKGSDGTYIFCFSGMAQSSIAMILPGFLVLNSALELQSKNVVSGSVRMVYSIIYVLFLGFGLLVGTTIFGLIKRDAVDDVSCSVPEWFAPENNYKLIYTRFIWAPLFAICLAKVYNAKWKQLPVMALIAVAGHQANFWISTQLSSNLQVANAIGAFVIGCLANLYSRMFHGLAAAAMLPAIYCQVPGGLAASGSLVAGIDSANQIFGNSSSVSIINNGTQGFVAAQQDPSSVYGGTIFNVGYGMVQVSIGISVGLYLSALVIYPLGKRRSGLFSF